jgi:hypothetical protein
VVVALVVRHGLRSIGLCFKLLDTNPARLSCDLGESSGHCCKRVDHRFVRRSLTVPVPHPYGGVPELMERLVDMGQCSPHPRLPLEHGEP